MDKRVVVCSIDQPTIFDAVVLSLWDHVCGPRVSHVWARDGEVPDPIKTDLIPQVGSQLANNMFH